MRVLVHHSAGIRMRLASFPAALRAWKRAARGQSVTISPEQMIAFGRLR